MKINITHILLFLIIICLLYTLLSNCGCNKDGFSVGGQICINNEHTTNIDCNTYTDEDSCVNRGCDWSPYDTRQITDNDVPAKSTSPTATLGKYSQNA